MNALANRNPEPTLHDVIEIVQTGFEDFREDIQELKRHVGNLEVKIEDFGEELAAVARAVDKDAVLLLDHERRITRLEKPVR